MWQQVINSFKAALSEGETLCAFVSLDAPTGLVQELEGFGVKVVKSEDMILGAIDFGTQREVEALHAATAPVVLLNKSGQIVV